MIVVLSPAKSLDFETPNWRGVADYVAKVRADQSVSAAAGEFAPSFPERTRELARSVASLSVDDVQSVFSVSCEIAQTVYRWYRDWTGEPGSARARPALQVFRGEAYRGLDGATMAAADVAFAQDTFGSLSGLYGSLRPLDSIEPYRLDFGTRLPGLPEGTVFRYWRDTVTEYLGEELARFADAPILNLASGEYGRTFKAPKLRDSVIDVSFLEESGGARRTIGVYAKKARGLLARYVVDRRLIDYRGITRFDLGGYAYRDDLSGPRSLVFVAQR